VTARLSELTGPVNALASHYRAFHVAERFLLTGHSHQAWPDAGFEGQLQAWRDAAAHVDDKWGPAFEKYARVCRGYAKLLGDEAGSVTLAPNTHELVVRFLSALPLRERPRLVTTDGEFHSIRRQVDRLAEEGFLEIVKVSSRPARTVAERLAAAVDDRTAAVLVSAVFFDRGTIAAGLDAVAEACARRGAELMVDAYHALGVVPYRLRERGLDRAYVVGGGYKYLQLGEGNCFLRTPPDCALRPVLTGWFSEFGEIAETKRPGEVAYGKGWARFAGSTFDPTSQYRAAAVLDFFEEQGLTPELLREVSQHQVGLLISAFRDLDLPPSAVALDGTIPLEERGGFLTLTAPDAGELSAALREREVFTDSRGDALRFGPAPYLTDAQITGAMEALGEVVRARG
jgi:selenocysteine lyase/cysteine desulfurase